MRTVISLYKCGDSRIAKCSGWSSYYLAQTVGGELIKLTAYNEPSALKRALERHELVWNGSYDDIVHVKNYFHSTAYWGR